MRTLRSDYSTKITQLEIKKTNVISDQSLIVCIMAKGLTDTQKNFFLYHKHSSIFETCYWTIEFKASIYKFRCQFSTLLWFHYIQTETPNTNANMEAHYDN